MLWVAKGLGSVEDLLDGARFGAGMSITRLQPLDWKRPERVKRI
jgi:hypothetical protein